MMPTAFDQAIREMCNEAVSQAVAALADKYGFDAEEASRELNLGGVKFVRKRGPSPKKETDNSVKKVKDDKPKTKRAPTGYILYGDDVRPYVTKELTEALEEGTKLKQKDVMIEIARRWKALSDAEREGWNNISKVANED